MHRIIYFNHIFLSVSCGSGRTLITYCDLSVPIVYTLLSIALIPFKLGRLFSVHNLQLNIRVFIIPIRTYASLGFWIFYEC